MRTRALWGPLAALLLFSIGSAANAALILDAEYDPPSSAGAANTSSTVLQAQTLVVGTTGDLVEVQLMLFGSGDHALEVYALDVAGHPDLGALLGTGTIFGADLPSAFPFDWVSIALSIPVTAGDEIGLVLRNLGTGSLAMSFDGTASDDYTDGGLWTYGNPSVAGGGWYPNGNNPTSEFDAPFRIYVNTVPEPGTAALLGLGLVALARRAPDLAARRQPIKSPYRLRFGFSNTARTLSAKRSSESAGFSASKAGLS